MKELKLRPGDLVAFRYEDDRKLTVAAVRKHDSGMLTLDEMLEPALISQRFDSPEEIAMFLYTAGNPEMTLRCPTQTFRPRRIVHLEFVPRYAMFAVKGIVRPFNFEERFGGDVRRLPPWKEILL